MNVPRTFHTLMRGLPTWPTLAAVVVMALFFLPVVQAKAAISVEPISVAFLGVRLQNDNEGLEPTTAAERDRLKLLEETFKARLTETSAFRSFQ